MLRQILVRGFALATVAVVGALVLAGCGQKGDLYLPTAPAAAQRATLPQIISPMESTAPGTPTRSTDPLVIPPSPNLPAVPTAPATAASAPAR